MVKAATKAAFSSFQPEKKKMCKGLDMSLKSTRACMLYRPGKVNMLCDSFAS